MPVACRLTLTTVPSPQSDRPPGRAGRRVMRRRRRVPSALWPRRHRASDWSPTRR